MQHTANADSNIRQKRALLREIATSCLAIVIVCTIGTPLAQHKTAVGTPNLHRQTLPEAALHGFEQHLSTADFMQALAELYHVQPPLIPAEESPGSSPSAGSTNSGYRILTHSDHSAAKATANSTRDSGGSFISRQELGICDSADTPMTDSMPLDDAAEGASLDDNPSAPATVEYSHSLVAGRHQRPVQAPKPLCSQEYSVQHVSLLLSLCIKEHWHCPQQAEAYRANTR